jgi:hypothetical protein
VLSIFASSVKVEGGATMPISMPMAGGCCGGGACGCHN